MKRLSLLILCCASMLCAEAQKTPGISVSLGKEPLENILTKEQKDTIKHLTITGTPQEQDYKYLRETLMSQLTELNMRDADIDTLPPRAFDCEPQEPITIVLPQTLKHVSDSALYIQHTRRKIIITGEFPSLGKDVYFTNDYNLDAVKYIIEPSMDNKFLKMDNGNLCSSDGTVLYFQQNTGYIKEMPQNIRVIYSNVFENRFAANMISEIPEIPETVDSIGDRAFANIKRLIPTGLQYEPSMRFMKCNAAIPPKLGTDAFLEFSTAIIVPDNSVELYKSAEGWKELSIYGMSKFAQGIQPAAMQNSALSVRHEGESVILSAAKEINRITHYAADGKLIKTEPVNANEACVQAKTLLTPYTIIRVSYKDGTKDNIKLKP